MRSWLRLVNMLIFGSFRNNICPVSSVLMFTSVLSSVVLFTSVSPLETTRQKTQDICLGAKARPLSDVLCHKTHVVYCDVVSFSFVSHDRGCFVSFCVTRQMLFRFLLCHTTDVVSFPLETTSVLWHKTSDICLVSYTHISLTRFLSLTLTHTCRRDPQKKHTRLAYTHNKYRSLLQNIVSFIGLFCKRNL